MKLIFIRHGDPDYANDSLTEKGVKEATLLAQRVKSWENITQIYASPKGRAQKTASYSLNAMGRDAITFEWLREFSYDVTSPGRGFKHVPWDFYPTYWKIQPILYDKDNWASAEIFEGTDVKKDSIWVYENFDKLLSEYGYVRNNQGIYEVDHENDDTTLVFFCHLGISYLLIGHLLGIAPTVLWHTFFTAPTSVTIIGSEEMEKGYANFRIQVMGDTSHLRFGNEPVSKSGYFTNCFDK